MILDRVIPVTALGAAVNDVSLSIIKKYEQYDPADRRNDERLGARRFTSSDPAMSKIALDHMVEELTGDASRDAAAYRESVSAEITRLEAKEAHEDQQLSETLYQERERANARLTRDLEGLDRSVGPASAKQSELTAHLAEAENTLSRVRANTKPPHRPLAVHVNPTLYLLLLVGICVAEMPLNRLSFEYYFDDVQWVAWLMALGSGVLLILLAHFGGTGIRQFRTHDRSAMSVLFGGLGLIAVFATAALLIYVIAVLRQHYVNLTENVGEEDMASAILGNAPVQEIVATTTLEGVGFTFLSLNAIVFVAGVMLAFFRHDPDSDYEPALRRRDKVRASLSRLADAYSKGRDKLARTHGSTVDGLNRQIGEAENRLEEARASRNAVVQQIEPHLLVIARGMLHRAQVQRSAYFSKAGQAGIVLPEYELPSDSEIVAKFQQQSSLHGQPESSAPSVAHLKRRDNFRRPPRDGGMDDPTRPMQ